MSKFIKKFNIMNCYIKSCSTLKKNKPKTTSIFKPPQTDPLILYEKCTILKEIKHPKPLFLSFFI